MAHSRTDIRSRVERALVAFDVDVDALTTDSSLEEANIDSLDLVELSQILHDDLGIDVRPGDFEGAATYGDALEVVYRRAGA